MNRDSLLTLYDRFARLVEKLPGGLQKPILRELSPIREVFLEQRPARIILLGSSGKSVPEFLHALGGKLVETGDSEKGWRSYRVPDRGEILILDSRAETPQSVVDAGLAQHRPDLALLLNEPSESERAFAAAALRAAACGAETPLLGVAFGGDSNRARLAALLNAHPEFSRRRIAVSSPETGTCLPEAICALLPNSAKLEFARLTGAKEAQAHIAGSLLKSFSAVCGVIGLQPIPLADLPVLTALQTLMVGLIIHTSGKPVSLRLAGEFLGALGFNIGAGIFFRESARALIKFVPCWGNVVSGFVAGAGTYAIGRASIAYFIEEIPMTETRKLFRKLLPGRAAFKGLPSSDGENAPGSADPAGR
ncbi:MAG: hypothetical protein WCQ57_12805 [Verrucomicrobiota bacterium]